MVDHDVPTTAYTFVNDAPDAAVVLGYRAALAAIRDRLAELSIDLVSDGPLPEDVRWAVAALQPRAIPTRPLFRPWTTRPGITVELSPRDDEDMRLAAALAPWTIHAEGIADDQSIPYSANDTGTSATFELTVGEQAELVERIVDNNIDPDVLVVLPRKRKTYT